LAVVEPVALFLLSGLKQCKGVWDAHKFIKQSSKNTKKKTAKLIIT